MYTHKRTYIYLLIILQHMLLVFYYDDIIFSNYQQDYFFIKNHWTNELQSDENTTFEYILTNI